MPEGKIIPPQGDALRRRAENKMREKAAGMENLEAISPEETQQTLHELRVHQIELEIQNKELRLTQKELDAARTRYFDLYDMAPVGYVTLSKKGLILETNLTAATLLGVRRVDLVGRPLSRFIAKEDQDGYYLNNKQLFDTGAPQTCELRMVKKDGTGFWAHLEATTALDNNGASVCHVAVIDITERKQAEDRMEKTLESLRKAFSTTIQVLVSAVETRDPYTSGHQLRSADLALAIATEMGLSQEKIDGISMAGSIHDIGKLSIPAEILSKPTKLSEIELPLVKQHAQKGYEMIKNVESPWPLAEIVYQHHERIDGSGYPRNLKGDEILLEARILAVADVVESMASHRPYRPALGLDAALEEIDNNKGTLYDADAVEACLSLFREKGFELEGIRFKHP